MPREHDPRITPIQHELFEPGRSKFRKYTDLVVGSGGFWAVLRYELIVTCCSALPGALGLFLRSKLYPMLLARSGRNVTFGVNVVLRHPRKIAIGNDVVIDDGCCLDAKGTDNQGITIGNGVFVGRNAILSCKNGDIVIEDRQTSVSTARSFQRHACGSASGRLSPPTPISLGGPPVRPRRRAGLGARPNDAGDRRGRERVAWCARGRDRRVTHRSRCNHRGRCRRDGRDSGLRDRGGSAGTGRPRPARCVTLTRARWHQWSRCPRVPAWSFHQPRSRCLRRSGLGLLLTAMLAPSSRFTSAWHGFRSARPRCQYGTFATRRARSIMRVTRWPSHPICRRLPWTVSSIRSPRVHIPDDLLPSREPRISRLVR